MRRLVFWLSLVACGCGEAHEAADRTGSEADEPTPDGASSGSWFDAGASVDAADTTGSAWAASDAADAAQAFDANSEPVEGGTCASKPRHCAVERVDVRGTSPFGPLHITEVGVSYWNGFTMGTALLARGVAGERPVTISVTLYTFNLEPPAAACPVGEYRLENGASPNDALRVGASSCHESQDLQNVLLRVDRHDTPVAPMTTEAGSPVHFQGVLTISDPAWSLQLPFVIRTTCETWVDV